MKNYFPSIFILFFCFILYFICLGTLYVSVVNESDSVFTYPLDDSYIHLSIAKNIVNNGVWGINSDTFASASSSPLFTILLSILFFIFGVNQYIPILLNIIISILILFSIWNFFYKKIPAFLLALLLISVIIFTPLPNITLIGMEHILHGYLTLIYILTIWKIIIYNDYSKRLSYFYFITCFLLTISRYEGLFLLIGGSLILLYLKKYKLCFVGGALGGLSISIFGLFFISQGGTFFPYSIILKTSLTSQSIWAKLFPFDRIWVNFINNNNFRPLLMCFMMVLFFSLTIQIIVSKIKNIKSILYIVITFILSIILYVFYSRFGWLDRYEAFIFPAILCICFYSIYQLYQLVLKSSNNKKIIYLTLFIFLLYPSYFFSKRAIINTTTIPLGSKDIYSQQYQTARFIKKYYSGQSVAISDIGYPAFISNAHVIDLVGLGNTQIAKGKKNEPGNLINIIKQELASNDVKVAFIYKIWFPELYDTWTEIGYWDLNYPKTVLDDDKVTVYILTQNKKDIEYLKKSLKEFNQTELTKYSEFIWTVSDSIK